MIATIEHTPDGPALLVYGVRVAEKPVGDTTLQALADQINAKAGWRLIEELKEHQRAVVGRWCCGGPDKGYWNQLISHWYEYLKGKDQVLVREWAFHGMDGSSPFYDDDGNYANPTHFLKIDEPPR